MDEQTAFEYMEKFIPPTLALLITALISLIIGLYLERFKTRLVFLKYRLLFQPLATSTQNDYWGNIEVLYNGQPTKHLNFITIEIKNDSNVDLQNVDVEIWVDTNSQILGHSGNYVESGNAIYLEQAYYSHFNSVIESHKQDTIQKHNDPQHITPKELIDQIRWIFSNKKFILPVLNRHDSIRLNLLVENFQGQVPEATVSVLHQSVKLLKEQEQAEKDKKLGIGMIIWGIIIFIMSVVIVARFFTTAMTPLIIVGIIGSFYLLIGLIIHKVIEFIKYLLS